MPHIHSLAAQASTSPPLVAQSVPENGIPTPLAITGKLEQYAVAHPINVEPPSSKIAYVVVHHPMGRKFNAINQAIPGVQEGQVVVLLADDRILPVSKLHLLHAQQYWTDMCYDDGEVRQVTRDKPVGESALAEHIESLVLGYTPEGVVTAKATWRRTRTPLAKVMASALRQRRWAEFTGSPVIENRTNKKTGKQYTLLTAHIAPINADEARALKEWQEDPDAQAQFNTVAEAYHDRLRILDSRVR